MADFEVKLRFTADGQVSVVTAAKQMQGAVMAMPRSGAGGQVPALALTLQARQAPRRRPQSSGIRRS